MELDELTPEDYLYCNTCNMVVDLWKYGNVEDAGHEGCKWRHLTLEEFAEALRSCRADCCMEER